jgi:mannosyltransferase OCH1-like enzyme
MALYFAPNFKTYTKYNDNMIPKIIFQTHEYKYEELPEWFKQTSMSWRNLNPGWEYVYHNEEQRAYYVRTQNPELYETYKEVRKPHQADIWRYLIVKNEGGVYADMDSFCTVPMDYILGDLPNHIDLVSTRTEKRNHTNNANFAAIKNSKILNECIAKIIDCNDKKRKRNKPDQQVIHKCFSDGILNNPDIVSKTMRAEHGATYKRAFNSNDMKIDYYGQEMTYLEFLSNPNMI